MTDRGLPAAPPAPSAPEAQTADPATATAATATATGGVGGRIVWTTADQVVSSATNAVVSFLVARQLGASEFGSFAVGFIAFAFASGLSRAMVTDALLIRFSGASPLVRRRAVGDAAGAMVLVGLASTAVCVAAGLAAGGLTGAVLVALGVVLPGLLLQGAWRQAFFADGRPAAACLNDVVWAVLQVVGLVGVQLLGGGAIELMVVWGAAAAFAAVVGAVQARARPHLRGGVDWLREHRDLGTRLATDFALSQGAANLALILVGVVATLAAVGSIRGAQVLLGPVMMLFLALTSFALPVLSRRVSARAGVTSLSVAIGALAGGLTLLWTVLLLLLPEAVGRALLGATWPGAREVLLFAGLQWVAIGVVTGATLGLKAHAQAAALLRLTLVQAPLMLVLGTGGAAVDGARGAVAGFVVAQLVGAALNWAALLRVDRSHAIPRGRHRKRAGER